MTRKRRLPGPGDLVGALGEKGLLPFPITEAVADDASDAAAARPPASESQIKGVLDRARELRLVSELGLRRVRRIAALNPSERNGVPPDSVPLIATRTRDSGEFILGPDEVVSYLVFDVSLPLNTYAIQLTDSVVAEPLTRGEIILVCPGQPDPDGAGHLVLVASARGVCLERIEPDETPSSVGAIVMTAFAWVDGAVAPVS